MSGSGTILAACALGRNVILVELEAKFVKMQQDNWSKIKRLGPLLGCRMGEATILQGDARKLPELLVDACVFSPPYTNVLAAQDRKWLEEHKHEITSGGKAGVEFGPAMNPQNYSHSNISNLPYGSVDAICTSPPYEGSFNEKQHNAPSYKKWDKVIVRQKYSDSTSQIGNLKEDNYLQAMYEVYLGCRQVLKPDGLMILVTKNFIRNKKVVRLDLDTIKLCENAGFNLKEILKRKLTQQSFWRTIYYQKFPDVERIEYEDVLIFKG
jgi:DNA modification methylase